MDAPKWQNKNNPNKLLWLKQWKKGFWPNKKSHKMVGIGIVSQQGAGESPNNKYKCIISLIKEVNVFKVVVRVII